MNPYLNFYDRKLNLPGWLLMVVISILMISISFYEELPGAFARHITLFDEGSALHQYIPTILPIVIFGAGTTLLLFAFTRLTGKINKFRRFANRASEQNDFFRMNLNSLGQCVIMTDKNDAVIYINESAALLTGWSQQQAMDQPLEKVYRAANSRSNNSDINIVNMIRRQQAGYHSETLNLFKAGTSEQHPIQHCGYTMHDHKGRYSGSVLLFNEVMPKAGEQEAKYQAMIEQASDAIFINDTAGHILEVNDAAAQLLGMSKEEIQKRHIRDLYVAGLSHNENDAYLESFEDGKLKQERLITNKAGNTIPVEVTAKVLPGNRVMEIVRDISERRRTERETRNYKFALDRSSIVDITDQHGVITYINDNFCYVSKYATHELMGKPNNVLSAAHHGVGYNRNMIKTLRGGNVWKGEIKNKAKDGSYFWTDTTTVPCLNEDGTAFQFINVRTDITSRMESQEKMKAAIDKYDTLAKATSDTIWDWDIPSNKVQYSAAVKSMFGYELLEADNASGWWKENIHPEDWVSVNEALLEMFHAPSQQLQMEYRFKCADNSYKYILDRAFILHNEMGQPVRVIGTMQDVTYKRLEDKRISKAIIDAQEEERNYIGAELHDNINQILAGALLNFGMVKKNNTATVNIEYVGQGKGHVQHAIEEIRKLSHSLAPVSFEDHSLKMIFTETLNNINVSGQFEIDLLFPEFDESKVSNEIQINMLRILQEQLKNILKHSQANRIEVDVAIGDQVMSMRTYDNGKGFDVRAAKKGIGLRNIRRRIWSLRGTLTVNAVPGKGCEMFVEIPLQ